MHRYRDPDGTIGIINKGQQSRRKRMLAFSLAPAWRNKMQPSLPSQSLRENTADVPTSVYRYYDVHDLLVYVGITARNIRRNGEHNLRAQWWPYVVRQDVEHFATRPEAEARERSLIRQYRPPFNVQHNPDYGSLRAAYLAFADGRVAESPREMWARLKRRLPLTVQSWKEGMLALVTDPSHQSLASQIRFTPETRLAGCGLKSQRVQAIERVGLSALIVIRGSSMSPVGSATAHIKMGCQKPEWFAIKSIACFPPPKDEEG